MSERLTERDRMHLGYLRKARTPLWGGHLQRGEPISDPDMQRWLDLGLIEAVGTHGYVATNRCEALLARNKPA